MRTAELCWKGFDERCNSMDNWKIESSKSLHKVWEEGRSYFRIFINSLEVAKNIYCVLKRNLSRSLKTLSLVETEKERFQDVYY